MQNYPFVGSTRRNEFFIITERSLMKRMLLTGVPSSLLRTQYRMHPHISEMISRLFYEGRLIDGENVKHREEDKRYSNKFSPSVIFPGSKRHSIFVNVTNGRLYKSKKGPLTSRSILLTQLNRYSNRFSIDHVCHYLSGVAISTLTLLFARCPKMSSIGLFYIHMLKNLLQVLSKSAS